MIRSPAVAGRFYPADRATLEQQVDSFLAPSEVPPRQAIACLVPHAGYIYSGHVAGAVYARLDLPARFILLGPRHYPRGAQMAILSEGAWRTPLGDVQLDAALAAELRTACPLLREDSVAHEREHALEVQLPFLQRRTGDFRFVPVALGAVGYDELQMLGRAIARIVTAAAEPVMIVASSDMNHYESDGVTRVKDGKALEQILALDARGLADVVAREQISMCGVAAAVSAIIAARELGAEEAELVRYATSGDISGDREEVVGYAGVVIR
ncbi:MAG: AmmeMemoRadiSam system protein B [Candidatus Acidiferrales bacterium]